MGYNQVCPPPSVCIYPSFLREWLPGPGAGGMGRRAGLLWAGWGAEQQHACVLGGEGRDQGQACSGCGGVEGQVPGPVGPAGGRGGAAQAGEGWRGGCRGSKGFQGLAPESREGSLPSFLLK